MGIDVLELEIKTQFPVLGGDLSSWRGFQYADSKIKFKTIYNGILDTLLERARTVSISISAATEKLKKIKPLQDGDAKKPQMVELYNRVYEMYQFLKETYKGAKSFGAIEPEIEFQLKELIQLLHNQRKVLLNIIEGDLREALHENSTKNLMHKMEGLS